MKKTYEKWCWEGGMTAKISAEYISLKPKPRLDKWGATKNSQDFKFLKSKPEIVELVAKQMLQAVDMQRKIALEESPKY